MSQQHALRKQQKWLEDSIAADTRGMKASRSGECFVSMKKPYRVLPESQWATVKNPKVICSKGQTAWLSYT